ncbi:MAG: SDR family NAD(P)-dependent oxidoreductase [Verrucomicrobia bacterium]|nr:SDR family NAD(P)-dependent oxidoreductase [Verrucomicrobiota bacterium]
MNDPFFSGKTAVITGAGGTLCSAIARHLAAQGTRVALLGRTPASLEQVAADIRSAGGTALTVACDVTDPASVERARAAVVAEFGVPWFLINGAGGNQTEAITTSVQFDPAEIADDKPAGLRGFFNLDPEKVDDVIRTNTLGTIIPSQVFGRDMAAQHRGSILTFGSMTSYRPITRVPAYATAKTGMVSFTAWLAAYLAPAGIRVNGVAPGFFVNDRSRKILMNPDGSLSTRGQNVIHHTPLRRFGEAEELLGTVTWLLHDDQAKFVTGIMVPVDGGFLACPGV